jgi:hypothetical protein
MGGGGCDGSVGTKRRQGRTGEVTDTIMSHKESPNFPHASILFLRGLIFYPKRCMRNVPPKHLAVSELQGVETQIPAFFALLCK